MAIRHVGCEESQRIDLQFREIDHQISIQRRIGSEREADGRLILIYGMPDGNGMTG